MKKLFSGLLALALALSLLPAAAWAAVSTPQDEILQTLSALEIMVGDESGNLNLSAPVTRAEFTKMAISASVYKDNVGEASVSPYPDVPKSHWAAGYVQAAVNAGLITGYLDGTFRPNNTIALAEGVTMVLRLLGYQNSDFTGAYPTGQMALYRSMELDSGVSANSNTAPLTRQDCMYLFYNLLTADSKATGAPYIITLGHSMTPSGEIDLVALVNDSMDGPVVASGNWQSKLDMDPSAATVYRAGVRSSYSAIQENDVVYWSKSMRTLWVYTNRAAGTINAISPTSSAPTSVTVAGRTYAIETSAAAYSLSDLGTFQTGNIVTLLLGRSGGVAAVLGGSQTTPETVYGLVTATGTGAYTDADGNSYTANTITLFSTDGDSYTYRCDNKSINPGYLVQLTNSGGTFTAKRLSTSSLSGKVSADGAKLGDYTFAEDVQILDTYKQSAVRIYPSRLAGRELSSSAVRYYQLNSNGEISRLILNDATGDMHTYGVLTSVSEVSGSISATGGTSGVYVYDAAGMPGMVQGTKIYNAKAGPMVIQWDGETADKIANLTSVRLNTVSGTVARTDNRPYTISDQVIVYELRNGDYYTSSVNLVNEGGYSLTGYYDRAESEGGRIRVIIARAVETSD